jgi:hypothetical protein
MDDKARNDAEREARGRRDLERLRSIARLFDQAFGIPGTRFRFGIDALFGLVPGLGDIAGAVVGVYGLHVARGLRVPAEIQLHMLANVTLDALIGTIPIIGDLFDFAFKAQTRNLALLESWLAAPQETRRRSRRGMILVPLVILVMFISLTIIGLWMLFLVIRWLFIAAGG